MAARIASFVGTVQLRLKIEQATTTEDGDPTPLYLMDEVAKAIGSNSKNILDAVDIIQQRLHARSVVVKQKALKLVKHLAQRGSPQLKQALARHSSAVRDLTHFKCAPDPFKGDIPWKRVQEYAKEALEALHAAPQASAQTADPAGLMLGKRIQGFGNDSSSSSTTPYNNRTTMIGFGSDSISSSSRGALERSPNPSARANAASSVFNSISSSMKGFTDRAMGSLTRPEHRLMNSMGSDDFDGYHFPAASTNNNTGTGGAGGDTANTMLHHEQRQQQMSLEQRTVDKICVPKGARIAPSSEDVKWFIDAVERSDGLQIAACLQKKLERGSWQETLRALCALEALLEKSSSASAGEVAVHFQGNPEVVRRARQSTQSTVRQRAERVLRLLGDETLPDAGFSSNSAATSISNRHNDDLLLGHTAMTLSTSPAGGAGGVSDLLAGLDVSLSIPPPPPQQQQPQQQVTVNPLDLLLDAPSHLSTTHTVNSATSVTTTNANGTVSPIPVLSSIPSDPFGDWASSSLQQQPLLSPPIASSITFTSTTTGTTTTMIPPPSGGGRTGIMDAFSDLSLQPSNTQQSSDPFNATIRSGSHAPNPLGSFPSASSPMGGMGSDVRSPMKDGQHQRRPSVGVSAGQVDVLSAWHAATSGISSVKREDAAFSFVLDEMKKK